MSDDERQQLLLDNEHLRLLRIGYLIAAAWNAFWSLFPLMYVAMGVLFLTIATHSSRPSEAPPRVIGFLFIAVGLLVSGVVATLAVLKFLTARALHQKRQRSLCLITAAVSCLAFPYGTVLGVATFVVLSRPSVRQAFVDTSNSSVES